MATSYYHVMAPGEMAGGGAGKSMGGGAESGGAVCEDWNALTLKMAHLHSRMENAEAKLAKKSAEQATIVARAEKAETAIIAATEAKEEAIKECEALGVQVLTTTLEPGALCPKTIPTRVPSSPCRLAPAPPRTAPLTSERIFNH